MRGLGWQFGADLYIPRDLRPSERSAFLWATATSTLKHLLVFDTLESLVKLVPEVGSPHGGTIFKHNLPFLQRYILSTAIHLATGTCLISGFEMVHGCITLLALIAFSSSPGMWPPLMDNPWISDSLHIFWAKRWHQVLRQSFLVYGGFLGQWLAGDIGMLFGTFFASGMFHECAAYMLGKGFSWLVVLFFMSQALLLLLEKLWRRTTGKRLGGIYGRLWVYFCVFVMAQPLGTYAGCSSIWLFSLSFRSGLVVSQGSWWWPDDSHWDQPREANFYSTTAPCGGGNWLWAALNNAEVP